MCHASHVDQCDWEYQKWDEKFGPYSARTIYLAKAKNILSRVAYLEAIAVIECL